MKLRRVIAMALCTCIAGGMLAGCGEKQTNGGVETVTFWSVNAHSKGTFERLPEQGNSRAGNQLL